MMKTEQPCPPKTPPRTVHPECSHSTPISLKVSGNRAFNSGPIDAKATRTCLASEVAGHFIGPMPPSAFLEAFLKPPQPLTGSQQDSIPEYGTNIFNEVPKNGHQKSIYDALNTAVFSLCPNHDLVYTHANLDPDYKVAPDVSMYRRTGVQGHPVTSFHSMDGWVELKTAHDPDPFQDPPPGCDRKTWVFESPGIGAADIRGQLASYAAAHMDSRVRTHSISLLIRGHSARFIRWDRSSAIVSESIDYPKNPSLLVEFLWSFSHASPDMLGMDPTVTEASVEEIELSRLLLDLPHDHVDRIAIPSRDTPIQSILYLIPRKYHKSSSSFGRGTRSTTAVRLCDRTVVFVKDYWRVTTDGLLKEGEIYRKLEDANVPHIAPFDRGNDIDDQHTIGHLYSDEPWACKTVPLSMYRHYRMSLSTVGRDLTSFHSTWEYTRALSDAMEAHTAAFFDANVLHRDISVGNIIITDEGEGLLIDWDLSAVIDSSGASTRLRKHRTGTWQFISCHLLQNSNMKHTLVDDRESFLWVLIWVTLRFSATNLSSAELGRTLKAFDECYVGDGFALGGNEKAAILATSSGEIQLPSERSGLHDLIEELRGAFAFRYYNSRVVANRVSMLTDMEARDWLFSIFRNSLGKGNWPRSDKAVPQTLQQNQHSSNRKRNSDQAEL